MQNSENISIQKIDLEKVLKERNPRLLKIIPAFIINWLKRIIHEDKLNYIIEKNYNKEPHEFAGSSVKYLNVNVIVKGKENLPPNNKRMVFVANHPLGGLDGLALVEVVYNIYGEVRFPVNDLLLNVTALKKSLIPINKHGKQSREAIRAIDDAFKSDFPILYFPAGLCSRKVKGKITDLDWKKGFLTQSIRNKRDIVPVHINGENSNFFYNLSNFRKAVGIKANIEMLFLVNEMTKQKNKDLIITFGEPIPWQTFDKSKTIVEWTNFIRNKTYELE